MLSHEKLNVYKQALEFQVFSIKTCSHLVSISYEVKSQFERASLSILLNIAEACGKTGDRDKQRFFSIARGSAHECAAILDVCLLLKVLNEEEVLSKKSSLKSIISMLTRLCFPPKL